MLLWWTVPDLEMKRTETRLQVVGMARRGEDVASFAVTTLLS